MLRHADVKIDFDRDTCITKVSIVNFEVQMPELWAWALARNAHPKEWSNAVPDFFLKSSPAKRDGSGWYEHEWDSAAGGELYEVTRWPWGPGMAAEVHNILEISNVETASGIAYEYSLRECLRSNMGVIWEDGGLDVDEGFYRLEISPLNGPARPKTSATSKPTNGSAIAGKSNSPHNVRVKISAEKSVRYTAPRVSPAGVGTVLNLMAPATVSMLMRRLVLDSVYAPGGDNAGAASRPPLRRTTVQERAKKVPTNHSVKTRIAPPANVPGLESATKFISAWSRGMVQQANVHRQNWMKLRTGTLTMADLFSSVGDMWQCNHETLLALLAARSPHDKNR